MAEWIKQEQFLVLSDSSEMADADRQAIGGRTRSNTQLLPCYDARASGEVAEWSKAPVSKTGRGESLSGVRISPSPPNMNSISEKDDFETLGKSLESPEVLEKYKNACGGFRPSLLPQILGGFLVFAGNLVYGKKPSYLKFRAVEVIARVPYQSWTSAIFTLLTFCYTNETRAMELSKISRYATLAQDNETMHVIVISKLAKAERRAGVIRHTLIPMLFAFVYFWASYFLYLLNPRWSHELNYLFENHAFEQYSTFIDTHVEELKKKPLSSEFLSWYGRTPVNQYEFFISVRNDELIHRNTSCLASKS